MILEVQGVIKRFDGLLAIDQVSLDVPEGCIYGVLGPNGAGKTTFFNLLSGLLSPTSGRIVFRGRDISGMTPDRIAHLGMGRTFQLVRPFTDLTVEQNVLAAIGAIRGGSFGELIKRYRGRAFVDEARELLSLARLDDVTDEVARNLPLGMLRRLEVARALGLKPAVLLLDESFSGLSSVEVDHLMTLVRLLRDRGTTVLLIEHNMRVAMNLCERIAILNHGRKIAEGTPEKIQRDDRVIEAYLGEEAHA